jgi:2-oxo-hept-3-ene-1,7-dioate hydratase
MARNTPAWKPVRGHKIGLTSRAMQQASQISEPDFGTLMDDMFFEPGDIPTDRFIAPRVEVELAFVLKDRLQGEGLGVDDVLAATEYVQPAIEIIDARIEQFDRHTKAMPRVFDTISDNAANAVIILGGRWGRSGGIGLRRTTGRWGSSGSRLSDSGKAVGGG